MATDLSDAKPLSISASQSLDRRTSLALPTFAIDIPMYLSAMIGMLSAFLAVDSVVGSSTLTYATAAIVVFGFVFAMFYRRLMLPALPLNITVAVLLIVIAVSVGTGYVNLSSLVPYGSIQSDLTLALVIQCLSALYSFTLIDDKRVLMSSIISMAMIGLVATYSVSADLVGYFLVYMVATIFLLLHQSFQMFRSWGATVLSPLRTKYLILTQLGFAVLGSMISLVVGTIFVTPLQAIGSHLSLASALKSLANLAPNSAAADAIQQETSDVDTDTSTFAIGQGPTDAGDNRTVLLRAVASDMQPHYLRGRTYDHYTGSGWESSLKSSLVMPSPSITSTAQDLFTFNSVPADTGVDPGHEGPKITIEVSVARYSTSTVYALPNIQSIELPFLGHVSARLHGDGLVELSAPTSSISFIATCQPQDTAPQILMHDTEKQYPPDIRRLYVDQRGDNINPDNSLLLSKTATSIINSIPLKHRNEFTEARAIEQWVSHQADYSLDVDPVPSGQDAVTYFLFNSKEGYCDLYASSMALLCRYAGIPARVVTGFDAGQLGRIGGYQYTAADKHAWDEIYFPGYGWQQFDPTIGSALAKPHVKQNPLVAWLQSELKLLLHGRSQTELVPRILTFIALCALVLIIKNEVFGQLRKTKPGSQQVSPLDLTGLPDARIYSARSGAIQRWRTMSKYASKWRRKQDENESCLEYTRSLTDSIAISSQLAQTHSAASFDPKAVTAAVRRLSLDFVTAKYADTSHYDEGLILRNENDAAAKDLEIVIRAAAQLPKRSSQTDSVTIEQFKYTQRELTRDPLFELEHIVNGHDSAANGSPSLPLN